MKYFLQQRLKTLIITDCFKQTVRNTEETTLIVLLSYHLQLLSLNPDSESYHFKGFFSAYQVDL